MPQQLDRCLLTVFPLSASRGQLKVGCGIGADKRQSCITDILVQNLIICKSAAFDLHVTLNVAEVTGGSAAMAMKFGSMGLMTLSVQSLDGFLHLKQLRLKQRALLSQSGFFRSEGVELFFVHVSVLLYEIIKKMSRSP